MTLIVGIFLCEMAAFTLALSMNIQQYALSTPTAGSSCSHCTPERVWGFGLALYGSSQFFFVMALSYAPLAIMSACFASVLIYDNLIARFILRKHILLTDVAGMLIILFGIILCAVYGPSTEYQMTADAMNDFFTAPIGLTYCFVLFFFGVGVCYTILQFEKKYPLFRSHELDALRAAERVGKGRQSGEINTSDEGRKSSGTTIVGAEVNPTETASVPAALSPMDAVELEMVNPGLRVSESEKSTGRPAVELGASPTRHGDKKMPTQGEIKAMADRMDWRKKAEVSPELELAMMVIYPVMLATIEAAAQALLKGWTGFIGHIVYEDITKGASAAPHNVQPSANSTSGSSANATVPTLAPTFPPTFAPTIDPLDDGFGVILGGSGTAVFWSVFWINGSCVFLIIIWLRKVYSKFETGECLPIEYGIQTVLSITAGLTLYKEYRFVDSVGILIVYVGAALVVVGIGVMCWGKRVAEVTRKLGMSEEEVDQLERQSRLHSKALRGGSLFTPVDTKDSDARRFSGTTVVGTSGDEGAEAKSLGDYGHGRGGAPEHAAMRRDSLTAENTKHNARLSGTALAPTPPKEAKKGVKFSQDEDAADVEAGAGSSKAAKAREKRLSRMSKSKKAAGGRDDGEEVDQWPAAAALGADGNDDSTAGRLSVIRSSLPSMAADTI